MVFKYYNYKADFILRFSFILSIVLSIKICNKKAPFERTELFDSRIRLKNQQNFHVIEQTFAVPQAHAVAALATFNGVGTLVPDAAAPAQA